MSTNSNIIHKDGGFLQMVVFYYTSKEFKIIVLAIRLTLLTEGVSYAGKSLGRNSHTGA